MEVQIEDGVHGANGLRPEMEMEIEKGNGNGYSLSAEGDEGLGSGESENGLKFVGTCEISEKGGGYNKNAPPADDVCPICFDGFSIPCRSNCGHWFCASCILQFWNFKSSIRPCKCPLCCSQIRNLKPEKLLSTQPQGDTIQLLKKVHQYNSLYISGVLGVIHRLVAVPVFMRKALDPDALRFIYYGMRLLGLFLAFMYEKWEFEFVPNGGIGIQRTFDLCASLLILPLVFIGLGYRFVLRGRGRLMAGMHAWGDRAIEQCFILSYIRLLTKLCILVGR